MGEEGGGEISSFLLLRLLPGDLVSLGTMHRIKWGLVECKVLIKLFNCSYGGGGRKDLYFYILYIECIFTLYQYYIYYTLNYITWSADSNAVGVGRREEQPHAIEYKNIIK